MTNLLRLVPNAKTACLCRVRGSRADSCGAQKQGCQTISWGNSGRWQETQKWGGLHGACAHPQTKKNVNMMSITRQPSLSTRNPPRKGRTVFGAEYAV